MKKILIINLIIVLLSACKSNEHLEKSLLWQVKLNKNSYPSFIYGTIHAMPEEHFKIAEKVNFTLSLASSFVGEMNFDQQNEMANAMLNNIYMKDGITLKSLLSDADYQMVKDYFEKESNTQEAILIGFQNLEKWKPLLLSSILIKDMIKGNYKAYDHELYQLAKKQNKKIGGLESPNYQFSLFDQIDYKTQAQSLVASIKELKSGETNSLYKMIDLYNKMDLVQLHELIAKDGEKMGTNFEEKLINERNTNWIPLIEQAIEKESTFFAVGAGHLAGKKGLIRQLRKKGYLLTPFVLEDFKP